MTLLARHTNHRAAIRRGRRSRSRDRPYRAHADRLSPSIQESLARRRRASRHQKGQRIRTARQSHLVGHICTCHWHKTVRLTFPATSPMSTDFSRQITYQMTKTFFEHDYGRPASTRPSLRLASSPTECSMLEVRDPSARSGSTSSIMFKSSCSSSLSADMIMS